MIATAPRSRDLEATLRFARARRGWAAEQLARLAPARPLDGGQGLVLFGESYTVHADGRRPRVIPPASANEHAVLAGCGVGAADPALVARAIRQVAQQRFTDLIAGFCAELGVEAPRLILGDARSRWGSCTPARNGHGAGLRLSWRLALAPPEVGAYVAAHECAHLLEPNHGSRFWGHVEQLVGDPKCQRAWLRVNGAHLHAFATT